MVGQSSCGKCKRLLMIVGLERRTDGEIEIDSKVITKTSLAYCDATLVCHVYLMIPQTTSSALLPYAGQYRSGCSLVKDNVKAAR